jgi:hypothetical protein
MLILYFQNISPGRKWLIAGVAYPNGKAIEPLILAIPLEEGPPRRLYASFCMPTWSSGPGEFPLAIRLGCFYAS